MAIKLGKSTLDLIENTARRHQMDPYKKLANAIVLRAVDDYRGHLDTLKTQGINGVRITEINRKIDKLEKFFRSEWFGELTNISGEDIIKKVRKEVEI